jgi:hypothetical protein
MKTYTLLVSDRLEFDVKFSLNDEGVEKPFGMRLAARRQPLDEQQQQFAEGVKVGDYLEERGLCMLSWIGPAALADQAGSPVPAGKEALDALCALVGGMDQLVYANYLQANGAKGRSGN